MTIRPRRRLGTTLALAALAVALLGCRQHRATGADCAAILDRLVDLELHESGYHDETLRDRWRAELRRRFEPDLQHCRGLMVPDDLGQCLAAARGSEEVAHDCLH